MRHHRITRVCEHCGQAFLIHYSRAVTNSRGRFCSRDCQSASSRVSIACVGCGKVFVRPRHQSGQRFCSHACAAHTNGTHRSHGIHARFFAKVNVTDGCHLWTAARNPSGYGQIGFNGKLVVAHRVAWMLAHGIDSIPEGMHVLHRCDNPACVNPAHLFLGTHTDNMRDKIAKGRQNIVYGEACGNSRLTASEVLEIRRLLAEGKTTGKEIAARFGVSPSTVVWIKKGKTWGHLP